MCSCEEKKNGCYSLIAVIHYAERLHALMQEPLVVIMWIIRCMHTCDSCGFTIQAVIILKLLHEIFKRKISTACGVALLQPWIFKMKLSSFSSLTPNENIF